MNVLGLFAGIGTFELGLRNKGFNVTALCEIEEHCNKVLTKNFPEATMYGDVKTLPTLGNIDVICGGFPCTDISIAGKGEGGIHGEKSGLWKEFKRVINNERPKYAIIENVFAILGRGLEVVLQDLAEIGYDATYTMLDSQYCGVPQRRRRVYILAVRDGISEGSDPFQFEERSTTKCRPSMESVKASFEWDFKQECEGSEAFTYLTRQRSDLFAECGVSSTLMKRDYKDFTDLIVSDKRVRKVTPKERLLLQGIPSDWWDGCGLTNTQKFTCNGMSLPAVEWIAERLLEFDMEVGTGGNVDADFYSDGYYRVLDASERGSSMVVNGEYFPSVFSLEVLKRRVDYINLKENTNET